MQAKCVQHSNRIIYYLIILQSLLQIIAFIYLYLYVAKVDSELKILNKLGCQHPVVVENESLMRRKRSSALPAAEDNAVLEVFRVRKFISLILLVSFNYNLKFLPHIYLFSQKFPFYSPFHFYFIFISFLFHFQLFILIFYSN